MTNLSSLRIGRALLAALALGFAATSAALAADGTRYYVNDHLATTVGIADAAGEIAALEADAFGSPIAGGANSGRFTGKPYDEDLGAYVFPFRNYRADEARWMSADPSGFPDGANASRYAPNASGVDPLGLFSYSYNYAPDAATTGFVNYGNLSVTQQFQIEVRSSGNCYYAVATTGYQFSAGSTVTLPLIGATLNGPLPNGQTGAGLITAGFRSDTFTHEFWHQRIDRAIGEQTFGMLESWTSGYSSNRFNSYQAAYEAGMGDILDAYAAADTAYLANLGLRSGPGHSGAYAAIDPNSMNWISYNPDWGQNAYNAARAITVSFSKRQGNGVCE